MSKPTAARVQSIDLLRGVVMVIMALDHVRDYFHADAFLYAPTDLEQTSVAVFLTRWITHYCAPVFVFLAGTSAWFIHQRKSTKDTSLFLLKRGLWLVVVECLIISFGWLFNPEYPRIGLQVIWAIGVSMIALSALVHLPLRWVAVVGAVLVFGHNALDDIHWENGLWYMLHDRGSVELFGRYFFFAYPVLPWIGTMALGYAFGALYAKGYTPEVRRRLLLRLGLAATVLFLAVRFLNEYGDPRSWAVHGTASFTVLSFLNLTKYPPSLLYLLMTLGPAILFLAWSEKVKGWFADALIVFGRVPFFFYVLHIYLIHVLAMLAAQLTGFGWETMILDRPVWFSEELVGYGFSLPIVYLVWIGLVLALYPLCVWFDKLKSNNRQWWWLSYL
ncbi:MAG: DUF1624 domain-containing protein [Flavobacteriales bacterium]|nr:DUF1624 domain-containing protein [Flavobacteriales bacterium]